MSYIAKEVKAGAADRAYTSADNSSAISSTFSIGWDDDNMLIDIVADSVTVTNAISVELEDSSGVDKDGVQEWNSTGATVSITADGTFSIAASGASRKLRPLCRLVLTIGADDAVTIKSIRVCQEK